MFWGNINLLVSLSEIAAQTNNLFVMYSFMWQVAEEMGDKIQILKIDTDENPDLSNQLRVILILKICNMESVLYPMATLATEHGHS